MDKYATAEATPKQIVPIQPNTCITTEQFISIVRDKLNETIEIVNTLREEVIKVKKK